ncbi:MAG: hypothetical protein E6J75_09935 [Deltaproteobacteria bacterium]|nr:MAG: hypothetical protein E6J75_09935 [Deltaproteobacteria bacterium]
MNPTASIERLAPRQVTEGEIHDSYRFQTDVIVGMCVEVGNLTPGQQAQLDLFRFDPVAGTVNTLPDAPARFLPCDPNFGTTPPVGASGVLLRGWRVVMNSLHALVGARTAYASTSVVHVGLGGSSCCTSYFTWGLPAVLSANSAVAFLASPGSSVVPSVVVKDSGGTPMAGATVTFAVGEGNGTIIGTTPVTTGADGLAQVSWQLPASGTGPFTLTATVPSAAGSPLSFTATGGAVVSGTYTGSISVSDARCSPACTQPINGNVSTGVINGTLSGAVLAFTATEGSPCTTTSFTGSAAVTNGGAGLLTDFTGTDCEVGPMSGAFVVNRAP